MLVSRVMRGESRAHNGTKSWSQEHQLCISNLNSEKGEAEDDVVSQRIAGKMMMDDAHASTALTPVASACRLESSRSEG